jgi:hypothetical protein
MMKRDHRTLDPSSLVTFSQEAATIAFAKNFDNKRLVKYSDRHCYPNRTRAVKVNKHHPSYGTKHNDRFSIGRQRHTS